MNLDEAKLIADLIEAKKHLSKASLKIPHFRIKTKYGPDGTVTASLDPIKEHIECADQYIDSILHHFPHIVEL